MAEARNRARERRDAQRQALRPLGVLFIAVVVTVSAQTHPAPGLRGAGLGVLVALAVYAVAVVTAISVGWARRGPAAQAAVSLLIGGCGVALAVLQPKGPVEIAASMGVWIAAVRLPPVPAAAVAGAITIGLATAVGLTAHPAAQSAITATLLCLLLAVTGQFIRRGRESQDHTELLLAQLQDAREGEAAAAALAERSSIAGELHDVLAHSLSGLTIQLQGARKLAAREAVSEGLRAAIERSAELAKSGLADARQASGPCAASGFPPWTGWRPWSMISAATPAPTPPSGSTGKAAPAGRGQPGSVPRRTGGADQHRPLRARRCHGGHRDLSGGPDRSHHRRPRQRAADHDPRRRGRRARADGDARTSRPGRRRGPGRTDRRRMAGRA